MITGNPYSLTKAIPSSVFETGPGVPGTTGTLFCMADCQLDKDIKYQLS